MFKKVKLMYKESIANVYKSVIDKISHIMKDAPSVLKIGPDRSI